MSDKKKRRTTIRDLEVIDLQLAGFGKCRVLLETEKNAYTVELDFWDIETLVSELLTFLKRDEERINAMRMRLRNNL